MPRFKEYHPLKNNQAPQNIYPTPEKEIIPIIREDTKNEIQMFRALTVPNSTDTPVLILNPDMCTASIGTMRSAKSNVASLVIVQPSEIEQNRGSSYIEPTRTYDVLKRQIAVGSQAGGNVISMKVYMLPTSTQVSRAFCQPETKSLSTEVLHLETLDTGIMFCISIERNC